MKIPRAKLELKIIQSGKQEPPAKPPISQTSFEGTPAQPLKPLSLKEIARLKILDADKDRE